LTDQSSHRTGATAFAIFVCLSLIAALIGERAEASKLTGSRLGEVMVGTKGADRMNGKGGADRLNARGGRDSLLGGKGRDVVDGGKGRDRQRGGPGADLVQAVDGGIDAVVDGGPGPDRCFVDGLAELAIARGCEHVNLAPLGGGGAGGDAAAGLVVRSVSGLLCDTPLPVCVFTINGDGADAAVGTVTGGGGVVAAGAGVAISGGSWTATGLLGCTADGFVHVVIGSDSVDLPVDCVLDL
jgi:hypothetical protein